MLQTVRPLCATPDQAPASDWPRPALSLSLLALVVGSAFASVPLPIGPVPMTLQSLAVILAGIWGGPRMGAVVCLSYLALGVAGAPVFAGGTAAPGVAAFLRPTAGYLIAFAPAALAAGWIFGRFADRPLVAAAGALVAGHAVIFVGGVAYLAGLTSPAAAVAAGLLPFLPGTIVKVALGTALVSALPRPGRAGRRDP